LLVATVLTLIFLPALYIAWFRVRQPRADQQSEVASKQRFKPTNKH